MGVMECDRRGCPEIMCRRLILEGSMYICDGCYAELQRARESWPKAMTAVEVWDAIKKFMVTRVGTHTVLDQEGIDQEFKRLTGEGEAY